MKNKIIQLGLAAILMTAVACSEKKETVMTQDPAAAADAIDTTANATDTASSPAEAPAGEEVVTVKGEVTAINRGKDGYSAVIKAADGAVYTATISIPNMADPKQYRAVNVGETINVTGEAFTAGEDKMIKVTSLQ